MKLRYSDQFEISGRPRVGGSFVYGWRSSDQSLGGDGRYRYGSRFQNSHFTVVPAPVPLVASAALLPVGVGFMALMRKCRRKLR